MAWNAGGGYLALSDGALRVMLALHCYDAGFAPLYIGVALACAGAATGLCGLYCGFALPRAWRAAGCLIGGLLLLLCGFNQALLILLAGLPLAWLLSSTSRTKRRDRALAAARGGGTGWLHIAPLLLTAARDTVLAVALPLHLSGAFGWKAAQIGALLCVLLLVADVTSVRRHAGRNRRGNAVRRAGALALASAVIAASPGADPFPGTEQLAGGLPLAETWLLGGMLIFAALLAVNASVQGSPARPGRGCGHTRAGGTAAVLAGQIVGALSSGWLFQAHGLSACLVFAAACALLWAVAALWLPRGQPRDQGAAARSEQA